MERSVSDYGNPPKRGWEWGLYPVENGWRFPAEARHSRKEMAERECVTSVWGGESRDGREELQRGESWILDLRGRVEVILSVQWSLCLNGFLSPFFPPQSFPFLE